jgi:hypothetical protein
MPAFGEVEAVPTGGERLGKALLPYRDHRTARLLIVDDVWTTGASMEEQRAGRARTEGATGSPDVPVRGGVKDCRLSNILKKAGSTQDCVIQNLK